ncbi:hypothetical protein D3C72_1129600 [compost metagenome]
MGQRLRADGVAARHGGAEQLAHDRQRIALVAAGLAAERLQRALRLALGGKHHPRPRGRHAIRIEQAAGRYIDALVVGHAHLAERDRAGSEVEHQRRRAGHGHADRERVGAEARLATPVRGDDGLGQHVDEVDRDHAGGGGLLGPVAHAPQVVRLPQAHHADAMLARAADGHVHGLRRHRLAHAAVAVQAQHAAGIVQHADLLVQLQLVGLPGQHIARDHADAVRVMPAQVGADQVVRGQARLARAGARRQPEIGDPLVQGRRGNVVFAHVCLELFLDGAPSRWQGAGPASGHSGSNLPAGGHPGLAFSA